MRMLSYSPTINAELKNQAEAAYQEVMKKRPSGLTEIFMQLDGCRKHQDEINRIRNKFKNFVVVGIGGSSLGVRVLAEVFAVQNFHFIDNVDAVEFERKMKELPLADTFFIFTSKSGRTIETLAALEFINQKLDESQLKLKEQSLVITELKSSDLYTWALTYHVPIFELPKTVGGRFSVLTNVGIIPAMLMGLDVTKIRVGAARAENDRFSLVETAAQVVESFAREEWITVLWCYCSSLRMFGLWWQQLWAESLAKKVTRQNSPAPRVSTPIPLIGATDQHSVLQQIMEGHHDKLVMFLRVGESESGTMKLSKSNLPETQTLQGKTMGALLQAEVEGTQQALSEMKVSNMSYFLPQLDEENLGYLFMYYQLLIMVLGEMLDINAFDQPGVELGKVVAKKILASPAKRS